MCILPLHELYGTRSQLLKERWTIKKNLHIVKDQLNIAMPCMTNGQRETDLATGKLGTPPWFQWYKMDTNNKAVLQKILFLIMW